jgi:hypothetical protein
MSNMFSNASSLDEENKCAIQTSFSINPNWPYTWECPIAVVNGCIDETAFNYDIEANTDDGSCIDVANGCTDSTACNFDITANTDSGLCEYPTENYDCNDICLNDSDSDGICDELEDCPNLDFTTINTGNNMTLLITESSIATLNEIGDGNIGVFFTDESGLLVCGGKKIFTGSTTNIAAFGDDTTTDEKDGFEEGETMIWKFEDLNGNQYDISTNYLENSFEGNGVEIISNISYLAVPCFCINDTDSDGVCDESEVVGCMDTNGCNYDATATDDSGLCEYAAENYDCADVCLNDTDSDGVCDELEVEGCTDETAFNYSNSATDDDGSCVEVIYGCINWFSINYDPLANTDDESCISIINGCTDPDAFNYQEQANTDDGSCVEVIYGCINVFAFNYNESANTNDGSCVAVIYGCIDETAFNFDSLANTDDESCIAVINGCTDVTAFNYDELVNTDDGSCEEFIYGCIDQEAINFDELANTSDGSCINVVYGCLDETALNYDAFANTDDGSCTQEVNIVFELATDPSNIISTYNVYISGLSLDGDNISSGDLLGAFYILDDELICGGYVVFDGSYPIEILVYADDPTTSEIDGFVQGQEIIWIAQKTANTSNYIVTETWGVVFTPNDVSDIIIDQVDQTNILGCSDSLACNYNLLANINDGTCTESLPYMDCLGNCLNDIDLDGECDEVDYDDGIGIDDIDGKEPLLIKMIDILGKEQKVHMDGVILFYIYDNGRVEKKLKY